MWNAIRIKIKNNLIGILGTIAFHLSILVVLLLIRFSQVRSDLESVIQLEYEEVPEQEESLPSASGGDYAIGQVTDQLLAEAIRNIPVNRAGDLDKEISTEKFVQQIKENLDGSKPDAYYQQQERLKELIEQDEQADMYMEPEIKKEDNQENKLYEGPTTIYYSLENRYHQYLPIPVYKCEGAGEITVNITVDQRGRVVQVEMGSEAADANVLCFQEAARKSALETRFNADFNAPSRQKGTITYYFFAQ